MTDQFSFNVGLTKIHSDLLTGKRKPTKREVFSTAMSVYDPLGILSSFTMQAKLLMQDIWRSEVRWDAKIRDEKVEKWTRWLENLREIKHCKIPRCFITSGANLFLTQLHIFCDASLQAFSAVAYLRTVSEEDKVRLSLIMAKTRVAPVKPMTIPRLELQAALLATRIAKMIDTELDVAIVERIFWTDSTTVLQWIRSDPRNKQMFVANRLGEICELSRASEWRWIPSKMNPADDATRVSSEALKSTDRWCTGPDFLKQPAESWPKQKTLDRETIRQINDLEKRKDCVASVCIKEIKTPVCVRLFGWDGLIKWAERLKTKTDIWLRKARKNSAMRKNKGEQQRDEIIEQTNKFKAANFWYREIQSVCFPNEINGLKTGKGVPRGSKVIGLNLFIDNDGLLRAKGRVRRFAG